MRALPPALQIIEPSGIRDGASPNETHMRVTLLADS
jgi:hypothetical protein